MKDGVEIVARTDRGRVRFNNEDRVDFDEALGIAVLADGMGGQNAGEVASVAAVTAVMQVLREAPPPRALALEHAVAVANSVVCRLGRERPEYRGMGTTLVAAVVEGDAVTVAHVGDSRAYRFGAGGLERVTSDHSVVQQLVDTGALSPEAARRSPNRHIVTRALGMAEGVRCDLARIARTPGDVVLLCSDGLTDMLDDDTIAALCASRAPLPALTEALVDAALDEGGLDNVSVVAMRAG